MKLYWPFFTSNSLSLITLETGKIHGEVNYVDIRCSRFPTFMKKNLWTYSLSHVVIAFIISFDNVRHPPVKFSSPCWYIAHMFIK